MSTKPKLRSCYEGYNVAGSIWRVLNTVVLQKSYAWLLILIVVQGTYQSGINYILYTGRDGKIYKSNYLRVVGKTQRIFLSIVPGRLIICGKISCRFFSRICGIAYVNNVHIYPTIRAEQAPTRLQNHLTPCCGVGFYLLEWFIFCKYVPSVCKPSGLNKVLCSLF